MLGCAGLLLATGRAVQNANDPSGTPSLVGDYLEVRSCDVYTGPCFANGEMGLTGKEAMMLWSVRSGSWDGVALDGLKVIAVIRTDQTLGDVKLHPRSAKAVLVVDAEADSQQREALAAMVRSFAGHLIDEVAAVSTSEIDAQIGGCKESGCASVKAPGLLEISTRCFCAEDHVCGNESVFYPPLTEVQSPQAAFTELAKFEGPGLALTWENIGQRSAFLAEFTR
jgi:hypothetical protein